MEAATVNNDLEPPTRPVWFYFGIGGIEYRYNSQTDDVLAVTPLTGVMPVPEPRRTYLGDLFMGMISGVMEDV